MSRLNIRRSSVGLIVSPLSLMVAPGGGVVGALRRLTVGWVALLVLAAAGWLAPAAFAADSVYWDNGGTNAIRVGNLDGTGVASSLFAGERGQGDAIDPASGKIYWAGFSSGAIRVGNLDGSGSATSVFTGENEPWWVAVDPAAGKLYWADLGGAIRVGNLDGSGTPTTLFTDPNGAVSIAIDPAAGKIYWADNAGDIRVGNLNGSGTPTTLFAGEPAANGVAIDAASGKLYWADYGSGTIRVGNLNGSGTPTTLFGGQADPDGVAVDPTAGKIYWTDDTSPGTIRAGNLDGSGTAQTLFAGESYPLSLALLRAPVGAAAPTVTGGSSFDSVLSCGQGSWDQDLVGAFLYRAPRDFAYHWSLNGADIAGATASTYTASAPGSYSCRVTATNQAGSASETSSAHTVLAPALSGLSVSPRAASIAGRLVNGRCVKPTHKNRADHRCTRSVKLHISYTLSGPTTVTFTTEVVTPGRLVHGRCVKPSTANHKHRRCTQLIAARTVAEVGNDGSNAFTFSGKLARGSYQLIATPRSGTAQEVKFKLTS